MDDEYNTGVKINLISSRKLDSMTSREKLRFILDEVKKGTVLVLERGLTAVEEIDLIKSTMSEIDHQTFIGIEMQSYSSSELASTGFFSKLLGRSKVPKMSVIGPASLLKTIHKNGSMIQAMILTGKSIESTLPVKGPPKAKEVDEDEELGDLEGETPMAQPVTTEIEYEGSVGEDSEFDGLTTGESKGETEGYDETEDYMDTGSGQPEEEQTSEEILEGAPEVESTESSPETIVSDEDITTTAEENDTSIEGQHTGSGETSGTMEDSDQTVRMAGSDSSTNGELQNSNGYKDDPNIGTLEEGEDVEPTEPDNSDSTPNADQPSKSDTDANEEERSNSFLYKRIKREED